MNYTTPLEVKTRCVELSKTKTYREIYEEYYKEQCPDSTMSFSSFARSVLRWKHKFPEECADSYTLDKGTYENFIAHDATVQVSADGSIVQAWIKQQACSMDPIDFVEAVRGKVETYDCEETKFVESERMLEIPLFDMHWGIAFLNDYVPLLCELTWIIRSRRWDKIVIPFGQDFFHNDSVVNGCTTKGTNIEKVDMFKAVKEGQKFIYSIIEESAKNSNSVEVFYSPGNHDRSISWMFMQVLIERYKTCKTIHIDDSMDYRKVIKYGNNSIMITHGNSQRATSKNLAHIFPISFPEVFGRTKNHEVHAGHLHSESDSDIYGVMVRRLSSGNKLDNWSDLNDFIGANKRFMIFEWDVSSLKSIHYI